VSVAAADRFATARAVADAVLYEGYLLYPYRASARKNQVRWQFGVIAPRSYAEAGDSERWWARTECPVDAPPDARLFVRVRCLHLQRREVQSLEGVHLGSVEVDGRMVIDWDEATEEVIELPPLLIDHLYGSSFEKAVFLEPAEELEELAGSDGSVVARVVRTRQSVEGSVRVSVAPGTYPRVSVTIENRTRRSGEDLTRDQALARSLIGTHTMLAVDRGRFVSMIDPPPPAVDSARLCRCEGTYPVLVGADDVVLSAPIILYDHPEVAPESPGDLYDSTEIDEILALRVMTLTAEEKAEARATDARAAAVIDRCDTMPPEIWERLHGAIRSIEGLP
jgi:hypothetical protein